MPMPQLVTCADCQKNMTAFGQLLAWATKQAREMSSPDSVFEVADDFETRGVRVAHWMTASGDTFAVGIRIPYEELRASLTHDGFNEELFRPTFNRVCALLAASSYQHPHNQLEDLPYIYSGETNA